MFSKSLLFFFLQFSIIQYSQDDEVDIYVMIIYMSRIGRDNN